MICSKIEEDTICCNQKIPDEVYKELDLLYDQGKERNATEEEEHYEEAKKLLSN